MDELKGTLRRVLTSRFRVRGTLEDDTALFSEGLIDSMNVMELVSFVEEEIGCTVPPADIILENFDSINRIARFAEKLKGSA